MGWFDKKEEIVVNNNAAATTNHHFIHTDEKLIAIIVITDLLILFGIKYLFKLIVSNFHKQVTRRLSNKREVVKDDEIQEQRIEMEVEEPKSPAMTIVETMTKVPIHMTFLQNMYPILNQLQSQEGSDEDHSSTLSSILEDPRLTWVISIAESCHCGEDISSVPLSTIVPLSKPEPLAKLRKIQNVQIIRPQQQVNKEKNTESSKIKDQEQGIEKEVATTETGDETESESII